MRTAELAAASWESLFRAQVAVMRQLAADDIWGPISVREYDVLFNLSRGTGGLRLYELNREILLSQPSLSRLVERLEDQGLVTRVNAPDDGRGTLVMLTPAGRELQRQVGRRHVASIRSRLAPALADEEMVTLTHLCDKIRAAQDDATLHSGQTAVAHR